MIMFQIRSLLFSSKIIIYFFLFMSITFEHINGNEIDNLLAFKSSIKDPTHSLSNWNETLPLCQWYGITCSSLNTTSHVLKINLPSKNISGELSPEIFKLHFVNSIDLSGNQLHGKIPESVFSSMSLKVLNLSNNNHTGRVPIPMQHGTVFDTLDFSNNMITGKIPENIGILKNLRYLDLGGNALEGEIPKSISNLTCLEYLTLASNQLWGTIPNELGKLKNLKWVYIGYNNLIGSIPNELGMLNSLYHLDLVYNKLNGTIPNSFGNLTNLQSLFLYQNKLIGQIPPSIFTLESLISLDLSDNNLSGEIPQDISRLKNLQVLHLFTNKLTGIIPTTISSLPNLQVLQLWSNNLHGQIPKDLGKVNNLTILDLSTNSLSGGIPNSLCNSNHLFKLILFSNSLSGGIPTSLGSCHSLKRIRLQNNSLSGGFPKGFTKLENVYFLDASRNSLSGKIDLEKWDMPMLQMLNLAKNKFVGGLPDLSNSHKLENLDLSQNRFQGNILANYGKLQELMLLRLSSNEISGSIPENLASCKKLVTLDLSHNELNGSIPLGLGDMPVLGQLDLSENQLSGEIPVNLGTADSLVEVNISYNHLRGVLPSTGAFLAINSSAIEGNDDLCGGVHSTSSGGLPPCRGENGPTNAVWWGLAISIGVIMCGGIVFLCVFVTIKKKKQRLLEVQRVELKDGIWEIQFFDPRASKIVSMQDIVTLKSNDNHMQFEGEELSVNNCMISNHDIWEEIAQFGKIRHPNIVKLLGFCKSEKGGLFFIYDKAEGKCLNEVVHCLSWENRRKVALGIARALKFLHYNCSPSMVVGEISPERIIIDVEDGETRLRLGVDGLFGLGPKRFLSSSYVAPESKVAKEITDKNDIYGFGLILIELVTGRGPTDKELGAHNDIIEWARYCYSDCHLDTWIDPRIRDKRLNTPNEIVDTMNLGLQCTASDPIARPCSSDVVKTLESIMKTRRCVLGFEISR